MFAYLSQDMHVEGNSFLSMPYNEIEAEFQHHMIRHGRNYGTKEEYYYRLGLFTATYHRIKTHNAKFVEQLGFEMGFN